MATGPILTDELLDLADFVFGQQLGMHLVDADLAADRFDSHLVFAREHDHVPDAGIVQFGHDTVRLRADRVGDGNQAANVSRIADHDHGLSIGFQSLGCLRDLGVFLAAFLGIAIRSKPKRLSFEHAEQSLAL